MIGYQLAINAARSPDKTALVFGDRRYTFNALNLCVNRLANALIKHSIARHDRVATLINNCDHFIALFFAAPQIGAVFVPINFRLAAREVQQILDNSRPQILFVGTSLAATLDVLRTSGATLPTVVEVADQSGTPHALEAWIGDSAETDPKEAVSSSDIQLLVYSSGTTGLPKGVVWTHATTFASCAAKIIDFALLSNDATVVFGPLFHVGPLMDLAVPLLLRGGKLVIGATTGFDPAQLLRTAAREGATIITVYPTMWRRVLALPDLDDYDVSSLRLLFTGGEPTPIPVLRMIYQRFPHAGFINTYGSTESGPITTFLRPEDNLAKIGSVGKPSFGVELRIVDDSDRPLSRGAVGELVVRSPFVCAGYWERPDETAFATRGGWWHTGDLARQDEEGFVWIEGRKKDMIISGAENIYPIEVEQVIATLPGVAEVAVVGVPDAEWGEAVMAYIVRQSGEALEASQVVEHCRRYLASYKKPRHIAFVEALPRTTVNKVAKAKLREWFVADDRGNSD